MEIDKDYYIDGGAAVFTEEYLTNMGKCCGSGCRHCVYEPKHVTGGDTLNETVKKNLSESKN